MFRVVYAVQDAPEICIECSVELHIEHGCVEVHRAMHRAIDGRFGVLNHTGQFVEDGVVVGVAHASAIKLVVDICLDALFVATVGLWRG